MKWKEINFRNPKTYPKKGERCLVYFGRGYDEVAEGVYGPEYTWLWRDAKNNGREPDYWTKFPKF